MCDQQRLRPACAYAQSDQSLCKSLEYSMNVQLLTEHHLMFLSLTGDCTGSSEFTLVKIPHCWKSHVAAYLYISFVFQYAPTASFLKFALGVVTAQRMVTTQGMVTTPQPRVSVGKITMTMVVEGVSKT